MHSTRFLSLWLVIFALAVPSFARARPTTTGGAGSEPVRYLALGDSFTAGTGSPRERAFPSVLAEELREKGVFVALANLGVNGYTTQDLIAEELPEVRGFAPTLVTLAIGANDLVRGGDEDRYRARLRIIFAALKDAGVEMRRVYVLPQPDWWRSPTARGFGDPARLGEQVHRWNAALEAEARAAGAQWVDLGALMDQEAREGRVAPDGLHPDASCHHAWADALLAKIVLH